MMKKLRTYFIYSPLIFLSFIMACGGEHQNSSEEGETVTVKESVKESTVPKQSKETISNPLGKRMFILCSACHSLKKDEPHKVGPNLYGIFGEKAAVKEGFAYSDALKASGIVWDDEKMISWLKNPAKFVPGTNMAFVGVEKEDQMAALMKFLKEETK